MKITYSLQGYYEQVQELAKSVGKKYISVGIEMSSFDFSVRTYIEGYGSMSGKTIEESYKKMVEKVHPSPKQDIDITIEEPELQTEN